jgi:L-fuculose-phosphate aldolase
MTEPREILCDAGRLMFSKRLTDMCGGNISLREGNTVYMSPRFAGQRYHWDLKPDQLVVGDWTTDEIAQDPGFSREGWSHLMLYRCFPDVQAVVHAHPFHIMPFVAFGKSIEPVLEGTQKFGVIELCEAAPAHSKELAEKVVAAMRGKEDRMRTQAAAVLIPFHGIILAGKDFDKTLDALERVDENAYCLTVRSQLG